MSWLAFAVAVVYVFLGYALGLYFGRRGAGMHAAPPPMFTRVEETGEVSIQPAQAQELVERLQKLTEHVDDDVGRHATRVAEISGELQGGPPSGADSVLEAAARLIEANMSLQADLESAQAELQEQKVQLDTFVTEARTDALTGVANRRHFDHELSARFDAWQEQGTPLSLILVDVDHFKTFNDNHGHQTGDAVLREVAHILADNVREGDLVARYGGEEFAVVLPASSLPQARPLADRLRAAIAQNQFRVGPLVVPVTVSGGVAEAVPEQTLEQFIKRADEALYAAKGGGRDVVYWHSGTGCEPIEKRSRPAGEPQKPPVFRIAPFVDGNFPEQAMFCEVECEEFTNTGFTYLLPEEPAYDMVLLAVELDGSMSYMTGHIQDCHSAGTPNDPLYRVVCDFTAQADLHETSLAAV